MRYDYHATYSFNGLLVRIIAADSDPRCDVHVVALDDPDTLLRAQPSQLSLLK